MPEMAMPNACALSHFISASRSVSDPGMGSFNDAVVLKTFGEVPDRLDEL